MKAEAASTSRSGQRCLDDSIAVSTFQIADPRIQLNHHSALWLLGCQVMPRGKFLWLTLLLTALPLAASSRAEIQQPSVSNVIHGPATNGFASDTFYFVDIFKQLNEFAKLSLKLDNVTNFQLPDENVVDAKVYWHAFNLANLFLQEMQRAHTWGGPLVNEVHEQASRLSQVGPSYYRRLPSQLQTLKGLRKTYETFMCAFVTSAFITTVMDRNGDAWLFSDAYDNDLAVLDRAIARGFDAAYHSTRFHCFVYYEPLLPMLDEVYKRCIGDKLEALYSLQVN